MASRQVKKLLQQQKEAELLARAADSEDEEEYEENTRAPFNPFDLLGEDDEAVPQAEGEDDEEDGDAGDSQPAASTQQVTKAQAAGKSKSKKKKKKGKGGKQAAGEDGDAEEAEAGKAREHEDVDIDKLVQELNLTTVGNVASAAGPGTSQASSVVTSLLAVDPRNLRGDEELRRIFGASVVAAVDREDADGGGGGAGRRRGPSQRPRGSRPMRHLAMKRGLLVSPKDHWPVLDTGLGMEYVGLRDGVKCFRYTWSHTYRSTQVTFERCQATHDPNAIAALLQHAPYHVDALLAMYDLYRHLGENQYAEEVLARALYALEAAWHPQFDIKAAQCRLDFEVEENRGLYGALFRHVQALSRVGCHATALEAAKVLLALGPEDPLGVLCTVDYLALRAGKFQWLQEFVGGFEGDVSLALRPNFAFALALAALRLEQQGEGGSCSSSTATAAGAGATQPARTLLLHALLLCPSVLPRLITKLQSQGAGRESHWGPLLARPLFAKPHDAGSAALQHLAAIYVERSSLLWKPPDALEALRAAAAAAVDLADGKTPGNAPWAAGTRPADWAAAREAAFPDDGATSQHEFRHIRLSDFSDNVNALPREELAGAVGPIRGPPAAGAGAGGNARGGRGGQQGGARGPPVQEPVLQELDEEALMEMQEQFILAQQQAQAARGATGQAAPMTEAELQNANPFLMMLRSLLPWVNAGQQPEYGADEPDEDGEDFDGRVQDA